MTGSRTSEITNAISFDLEYWHSATLVSPTVDEPVDRIEESLAIVLDLLSRHDVSATFFVLGALADKYPDLVKEIDEKGHEIASHGYTHTPLFDLDQDGFNMELSRTETAIKRAVGHDPTGFRAPNFSITEKTEWALEVLESRGYTYDSSIFPRKTPMYGVSGTPLRPYEIDPDSPFEYAPIDGFGDGLVEFPVAVIDMIVRFPIAGGFYARLLPSWILEWGIRRLNRQGVPANLYFHPWEINPRINYEMESLSKRFVSYHGIDRLETKLDRLFRKFDFGTIEESANSFIGGSGRWQRDANRTQFNDGVNGLFD